MKGKLSKALAVLLACAMIFAALPLMAFAETETVTENVYTVSKESPAIPMTVDTKIAIGDLAVTFADGTVVAGDALTWTSTGDGVSVKEGYLIAEKVGPVKLTVATTDGKTRNVYAAVASQEDAAKGVYKFYTYDFAKGMGDEWVVDTAYSGTLTKNPWTYNEQGQLIMGTTTSKQMSYSKTKIDPVTGQFVPATYDPAVNFPSAVWIDTPYFYGSKYASTMKEALDKGIIKPELYNKAVSLGAYIPFVNTVDNDVFTYYKEDGTTATKGNMTQTGSYMYSKNPIFNEFTNYTSGAKVLNAYIGTKNDGFKFSMLGRVTYGTQHIHEYIGLQINAHDTTDAKGVSYARAAASDSSTLWFHLSNYGQTPTGISGLSFSALKSSSANLANANEFVEITTKFHGKNMTMSSGEETITTDCSSISRNPDVRAGSIGIGGVYTSFAVKEMYAAINSEYLTNLPNATATYYTVSYGAPAIPMNENTAVSLDFIKVEMDKNGTIVEGSDITWNAAKQEGLYLNKKDNKVTVYAAGNYKLTATANGVTKNVWVVAKEASATDFYLVNYDFTKKAYNPAEWNLVYYNSAGGGSTGTAKATDGTNPAYFTNYRTGTSSGYISVGPNNGAELNSSGGKIWTNHGVLVNNNEIFKDFTDYTVSTDAVVPNNKTNDYSGVGACARIKLTDTGVFDLSQNAILAFVMRNGVVRIQSQNGAWWANAVKTTSHTLVNRAEGATDAEKYLWYDNNYYETSATFAGENMTYSFEDTIIFNLDDASSSVKTEWNKDVNHAVDAGYPGIMVWGGGSRIRSFSVKLNSNAMPTAFAPEVEPEAEIVITGDGEAVVEEVVGSDNTYTVEIAPATGYKVKVGSLYINGKRVLGSDATGRLYTFTTEDLNETTISVEYIEDNGQFNTAMLGAQVNPEKQGIRFGSRTDSIKRAMEGATTGLLNDKIFVDGVNYDIAEIGMILVPTQLLDGELVVGGKYVVRQSVSKIVNLTDDFSDIAITLVNIPEKQYNVKISSRMYIAYTDANGDVQYIYTEVIERSYNDVLNAMAQ